MPISLLRQYVANYSFAVAAVTGTVVLRVFLQHLLGINVYPFVLFTLPVVFSAWFCGRFPAWVATLLSGAAIEYLFWPPSTSDHLPMLLFIALGIVISQFLAVSKEDLEKLIAERSQELETLTGQLRDREMLASLGLNASKVAHEIANPLNGMALCVSLLEGELTSGKLRREQILESVHDLRSEIQRLQNLLRELRALARPLELSCVPVSLATIVGEVLDQSLTTTVAQPVQIQKEFPDALPPVMADREKLKQVIFNLANNAIEAMPNGGRLTLRGYQLRNNICFEIQDTGVGIPQQVRIFDLFATSKPNGWGLGLCIARQIMTAHHGTIDYTSELGHGTTFKISLPAADRKATLPPAMVA